MEAGFRTRSCVEKHDVVELYLVFVLASALLVATPGPNVALIVGTSLTHGMRTGLMAVAGVNIGVMIQLAVVAAGLSWIVEVFAQQFRPHSLRRRRVSAVPRHPDLWKARKPSVPAPLSAQRAFSRGFAVAFANPEDADLPGGVPAPVPDQRRRAAGAALAARGDLRDHHGGRRCDLGAVRGALRGACRAACN